MSDHNTPSPNNANAEASHPVGTRKNRHIPMAFFRDLGKNATNGRAIDFTFAVLKADENGLTPLKLGTVFGNVIGIKKADKTDKNTGEIRASVMLIGTFEAVRYHDKAVMQADGIYLPMMFMDSVVAAFDSGARNLDFAIEIAVEKNQGEGVAYQYAIYDLIPRDAIMSPLDRLKKMVQHPLLPASQVKALPAPEVKALSAPLATETAPDAEAQEDAAAEPDKHARKSGKVKETAAA